METDLAPQPHHTGPVFVADSSILVDGRITDEARSGVLEGAMVIVPEAAVAELEALAAAGRVTGGAGLSELKRLRDLAGSGRLALRIEGDRPRGDLLRMRESGDFAAAARRLAQGLGATVLTSDPVQVLACQARGIPVQAFEAIGRELASLALMSYFDEHTMSVHLRARTRPRAKRGTPGDMAISYIGEEPLSEGQIELIAREIVEAAEQHPEGFIEQDAGGSTIVQLANLRIAIARPPFSDASEITAVRPVARTELADYSYASILEELFVERYRGVLVSGSPGAGKSTFVQAAADHLESAGRVIKTMEKPRDLVVSDEITQYTALEGDMANTADVLLLVRPDYTIFDEMRRTPDFQVFADMRMAGVGMIGVVHATRGIDAIQRLVGRVELGMIPQIVDTVVFIDGGDVQEILRLALTVKAPTGITDEGLARPVIEVIDYETNQLAYEIYTFAQQVVVMPIGEAVAVKPIWKLAARALEQDLRRMVRGRLVVHLESDQRAVLYVDDHEIGALVGRGGSTIHELEDRYGLGLDVRPLGDLKSNGGARRGKGGRANRI